MIISVYLHDEVLNVLQNFGTLDKVANRVVNSAMMGVFDMEVTEPCPPIGTAKKYFVDITNEEYLQTRDIAGLRSSKLSLRRMLYHFVNYELYNELGWKTQKICNPIDKTKASFNNALAKTLTEITKLYKLANTNEIHSIKKAIDELKNLRRS